MRAFAHKLTMIGFNRAALALTGVGIAALYLSVLLGGGAPTRISDASFERGAAGGAGSETESAIKPAGVIFVGGAGKLDDTFRNFGYDLDAVRAGAGSVPRLLVASLPGDLADLPSVKARKGLFIKTLLPLVLTANEHILAERARVTALRATLAAGRRLDARAGVWLDRMFERYGTTDIDELLRRVDVIPPSLAIAQAAEESGWGTSRFAREGNAPFGQRTYRARRAGIVPRARAEGESFAVRAYDRLLDAVRAYKGNLNTHTAYSEFRRLRAALRAAGRPLDGLRLAGAMSRYSERGSDYVGAIRHIIRVNRLDQFDRARLSRDRTDRRILPEA
ncbi:MAG: glucosaminidase domain-containing protein [Alphaproteobacteria bacterium]